jgi:TolB protein
MALTPQALAQLTLRVGPGSQFQPMPIAIAISPEGDLGLRVSGIIANNLQRSGYFTPLDKGRFPERPSFDAAPRFDAWREAGAQALVTGRVTRDPSGRLQGGVPPVGRLCGPADPGPAILHRSQFLAPHRPHHLGCGLHQDHRRRRLLRHPRGVRGRVGPKENRRKRLAIMDQDGANVRFLTQGDNLVVTPRYSP